MNTLYMIAVVAENGEEIVMSGGIRKALLKVRCYDSEGVLSSAYLVLSELSELRKTTGFAIGDVIFFSGDIEVALTTACYRCLEPVEIEEVYDFDEVVYAPRKEEDYDLIMEPEGQEIDLTTFTENVLDLKLPLRFLCHEECKGLCPVCGANLNTSECNCNAEKIDPRFAMLKNLLKDSNS